VSPTVTVSIPNWNGARFLRPCLDSLRAQTFRDFDVAIVDNGSTDDSLRILAEEYPEVRVVRWESNRGVAAAFNEGVRQCAGELLCLLNNDMELDAGFLAAMVDALDSEPNAGAAAAKILFIDRRTINSTGDFYGHDGIPGNRGVHEIGVDLDPTRGNPDLLQQIEELAAPLDVDAGGRLVEDQQARPGDHGPGQVCARAR